MRVAKGRDLIRRLAPALAIACMAVVFLAQVVLADSMTLSPTHGQPTDSVAATYTYIPPPTSGCPVLKLAINFWWDSTSFPIGSALVNLDANKNCVAVIKFVPTTVKGALTSVGNHLVIAGPNGTVVLRAVYTIDSPPPPPPTTPPPATPPPTHRPTPPPSHAPTPVPTPTPRCTTEGPAHNCVPVDCTQLTAAFLPFGGDGGVPPLMLLVVLLPIAGLLFRNRRLRMLSALMFVLLVSMSCARPTSLAVAPSPSASTHAVIGFEATPSCRGYWMASNSGGIFPFGDATGYGSLGAIQLNHPIVGMESTPDGQGYWLVASDGGVFPQGDAQGFGGTGNLHLTAPIVALEDTPDGLGYWLVARDGGIFPFGDATSYGSTGAVHLNQPIVDMEATPDGHGYWLVARDGGIFPFGDAAGFGGTGNIQLNSPIVGMDSTPDGAGYWLVAADGGIFPFGDAAGYGSTGNVRLSSPIVGMEGTPDGHGYWLFTRDGGIFPFGDAPGYGSLGGTSI